MTSGKSGRLRHEPRATGTKTRQTPTSSGGAKAQRRAATKARPVNVRRAPQPQADAAPTERTPDERQAVVARVRAAYVRAEAHGIAPGRDAEEWYTAEGGIKEQLARGC